MMEKMHTIVLESRKKAVITGVQTLVRANEEEVVLLTQQGKLTLYGRGLHIAKLTLEDGSVVMDGEVIGLDYAMPQEAKKGIARLFS